MSIKIHQLHFQYEKNHPIFKGCSLDIQEGEMVAILGLSGSGKSTLLRLIAGLEKPDQGEIYLDQHILTSNQSFIEPSKRKIGMVFQDYALFPHLSVYQNVAYALFKLKKEEKEPIVHDVLSLVGLIDKKEYYPHELSGGQQQRIALARSLVANPKVLLLDEPFSNLDAELRMQIRKDLRSILKSRHMTCIFATHDLADAKDIADRIYVLKDGLFIEKPMT